MCVNLHCEKPDGYCSSNDEPAADGTECGNGKVRKKGTSPKDSFINVILTQRDTTQARL